MPRNLGTVIGNNLSKGLITEATGLNFPENAVTDANNVVFEPTGAVRRRKGIDVEGSAETLAYTDSAGLIKEFVWQAVARTGGFTFLVLQIGNLIHFYELTQSDALSSGIQPVSLNLDNYRAPGSGALNMTPVSFAAGAGYLFIAHPMCDSIIVRWIDDLQHFEAARIDLVIRDFEGVEDTVGLLENPTVLSDQHHYNLQNQGWNQEVRVGTVSNEAGDGGPLGGIFNEHITWGVVS